MTFLLNVVKHNSYADSVALMRLSDKISGSPGIKEAAIMIGTPANKEILANANLLGGDGQSAGPGDIILAVRALDQKTANRVIAGWESELNKKSQGLSATEIWRPKTIRGAFEQQSNASMAMISVPGPFAIAEARKALMRNLNVLIFSDNVEIDEERAIKEEAKALGLIVMGPDCGTAIIQGKMLGFANSVPSGKIGIVGASGTGIQEVSCLLAHMGHGISHAIGVGGRDLTEQVGGISTLSAIDLLEKDPQTDHIIIIS
ncbi:MAG: oxidoreductase, partial [Pseudomonadota bacterium]|nr:oxidoreductase [Pseudomonadota bacterium]